jgi:aminopeptidase
MRDPRLDKLADVLTGYSTGVRKGDLVNIHAEPSALPLIEAIYRSVLRAGGHPFWTPKSESLHEALLNEGSEEQLAYVSPLDLERVAKIDVHIGLWSEVNTRYLSRVDPGKIAREQAARRPVRKIFMERESNHELRWCGTQFPTMASAQEAEMSLRQYEDFVFGAGLLDTPDPVGGWRRIRETQERLRERLQGSKQIRFLVPPHDGHDGTDLRVDVDGSTWINCAGESNFPDGEVFAGPRGAEGHVNYSFPAVHDGNEVVGTRLGFAGGRVVEASARKNEAFLIKMLDQDAGARVMGEIALGTNYAIRQFSRNTLFDEKIGGTFHAAVGAGYPESGNSNDSGLHWDMVCDLRKGVTGPGGEVIVDGEVISRDGKFLKEGWPGNG